ncbi:MAG: hypothetical protein AAF548_06680 [Actinomycetota bacterium]
MTSFAAAERLRLVAVKCTTAAARDGWRSSLATDAAGVGGGLFALDPEPVQGGPGPGHTHVLALPDGATVTRPPGGHHAEVRTDDWVRHGTTIVARPDAVASALIVAEVMCTEPAEFDDWDRWYDEIHLPDMMASDTFAAGTRWTRADPRLGTSNHLTVYEVSGITVDQAVERSAEIMPGLIAAGRKHRCHTGGLTMALVAV